MMIEKNSFSDDRSRWLLWAVCVVVASGCGGADRPERVKVSGQVLIDGQPLEHGFVQVTPAKARPSTGKLGPGGRFRLTTFEPDDGCVPGKHPVAVIGVQSVDGSSQRWHAPKKYSSAETSGLHVEIPQATDSLLINLTWDGGKPFEERFAGE